MFSRAISFNNDVSSWGLSNIMNILDMFENSGMCYIHKLAKKLDGDIDLTIMEMLGNDMYEKTKNINPEKIDGYLKMLKISK